MKHKLLKPVITNEKLVGLLALIFALAVFSFVRIFFYQNSATDFKSLLQMPDLSQTETNYSLTEEQKSEIASGIKVPILMYHHIGPLPKNPNELRQDLTVSAENFELQVAWLKGQGYESISLSELLTHFKTGASLPKKPVVFTFDDGYEDTLTYAPPILKSFGYKGDFGIITQFPGVSLGDNQYASWQEIRSAKNLGMEIVSHTQDHFDGTDKKYTDSFILRNLKDSQKDIQDKIGLTFPILIYPFGHYDARYLELTKQAGFEMGITTKNGQLVNLEKLLETPRLRVHGDETLEKFQEIIQGPKQK